ncbi:phosphatidylethanolamine N-methyltransferase family protein [Kitasatospora nipponensis]|uniref:Phosphatidylethanolamine N-methyltransferase family protein n=1 Tax=Kitasatospora nipponensis TaxID=258049 RepID=A0ABN1X0M8_9ACTN
MSVGLLLDLSVLGWIAAEVVMQVRQYRMGGRAEQTEWRSLGVVAAAAVAGQLLAVLAHPLFPWGGFGGRQAVLTAALLLLWLGVAVRLWAVHSPGRYFRGVVHVQSGHQVVRAGPYRHVRHPAYSGLLVAIVGLALGTGNLVALLLITLCTTLGLLYRIRVEERVLTQGLGAAYAQYATGRPRLIPGLR